MPSSYSTKEHVAVAFVCGCGTTERSACKGLPFYKKHNGRRYCVLHYPGKEKSADFNEALQIKLSNTDFDFRGVWFPTKLSFIHSEFAAEVYFSSATFNDEVNFSGATFRERAYFNNASFAAGASFSAAIFNMAAYFSGVAFRAVANFNFAQFNKGVDFISTAFGADALFSGATFCAMATSELTTNVSVSASFRYATFGAKADFTYANFEGANFNLTTFTEEASFSAATFSAEARHTPAVVFFTSASFGAEAYFNNTVFGGEAFFSSANFIKGAEFTSATFWLLADFNAATFGTKVDFSFASFHERADFRAVTFREYVAFAGDGTKPVFGNRSSLDLQFARIEKPDRFSFHTLTLRPHWFVNVDSRKFDFTNVEWSDNITQEIDSLKIKRVLPPHRLFGIACRYLALNAEESHRYDQASKFRYWAMDARRRQHRLGFEPRRLSWWYWIASGYGEQVWQAFLVLLGIWLVAAALYTQVGFARWEPRVSTQQEATEARRDEVGEPLKWPRALTYSFGVMTLQKPEPRPATNAAQSLVMLETILGPVQAALLALAIRRKFMR